MAGGQPRKKEMRNPNRETKAIGELNLLDPQRP